MKRYLCLFATLALCCTNDLTAVAQDPRPHRVALIDMGYVFKNYRKFDAMTAALHAQVEQADTSSRGRIEQMQQIQAQLESGALAPGSPDYMRLETQLIQMQTALQAERQVVQRDLLRKEADIYKTVYLEVQDAIRSYCKHYGYTLVLRFSRTDLAQASDPREILEQVNNSVVYSLPRDDVSDAIVGHLNDVWEKNQQGIAPVNGSSAR